MFADLGAKEAVLGELMAHGTKLAAPMPFIYSSQQLVTLTPGE
jgi:hypothetical protein